MGGGRLAHPDGPIAEPPNLLFQLNVTYADGTSESIVSDKSWKCMDGPIRQSTTRAGEIYDAREENRVGIPGTLITTRLEAVELAEAPKAVLYRADVPADADDAHDKPVSIKGSPMPPAGPWSTTWARTWSAGPGSKSPARPERRWFCVSASA